MKKVIQIPIYLFVATILFSMLHNFTFALFGIEESVFFVLSLLSAFGFFISVIYLLIVLVVKTIRGEFKIPQSQMKKSKTALWYYIGIAVVVFGFIMNIIQEINPVRVGNYFLFFGVVVIGIVLLIDVVRRVFKF